MSSEVQGHGWWPYWTPYLAFLMLVEIGRRTPDELALLLLVLKPALPAALFVFFALRGAFPELRLGRLTLRGGLLDVAVGIAGAGLWMAPYLVFPGLRPEGEPGFDAAHFGLALAPLALGLRALGFALVTPFIEELFIRSWLLRYAHVFRVAGDFRKVPIGTFSWQSFLIAGAAFVITHTVWEYPVALAWFSLTTLWFYFRKQIGSLILVHAVTNATILGAVLISDGRINDAAGRPLSLWFFL